MYEQLRCLGIEHLIENEDATLGLISYILHNGKPIAGYSNGPYIFHSLGYAEFSARTIINHESKQIEFTGMDVHCSGPCSWEMRIAHDVTPSDWEPTRRRLICKDAKDGSGMIVINVVRADVLPSFVEDAPIRLQLVAFPLSIELFESETAYADAQPAFNSLGKKFLMGDGSLFPIGFMNRCSVKEPGSPVSEDTSSDDVMLIRGKIKALAPGKVIINDQEIQPFIDGIIETIHGDLEVVFTFNQIAEAQQRLLKPGTVLSATVILSGDAAIKDYVGGFVKDERRHLALLRHTFLLGQAERLLPVLSEKVSYYSEFAEVQLRGKEKIVAHLNKVHANTKGLYFVDFATVICALPGTNPVERTYLSGDRCVALAFEKPKNYVALAFVNLDEENNIESIYLANWKKFIFKTDEGFESKNYLDEYVLPQFVGDSMILRAKFHGMVDDNIEKEDVYQIDNQSLLLDEAAGMMIDTLKTRLTVIADDCLERIFSYAFAQSSISATNEKNMSVTQFMGDFWRVIEGKTIPVAPASWTIICKNKFEDAVDLAKQFQKDYANSKGQLDLDNQEMVSILHRALKTVMQIGTLFTYKHLVTENTQLIEREND